MLSSIIISIHSSKDLASELALEVNYYVSAVIKPVMPFVKINDYC